MALSERINKPLSHLCFREAIGRVKVVVAPKASKRKALSHSRWMVDPVCITDGKSWGGAPTSL